MVDEGEKKGTRKKSQPRSRYLLLRRIPRVLEVVVLILGRCFWLQVVLGIVLVLIMGVMNTIVTLLGLKRYWRGKRRRRPHAQCGTSLSVALDVVKCTALA